MPTHDSEALSAAMAATDAELFASAMDQEAAVHDDTGDRSLEQQDDGPEGASEDEAVEGEDGEIEAKDADAEKGSLKDPKTGKFIKADAEVEKPEGEAPAKDEQTGRVPPARLREEAEKRRTVEAERDALKAAREEDKRERDALKSQMELLARQFAQRQPETPQPRREAPARPDKFADPDGYDQWVENQIAAARNETRDDFTARLINMNLANTREVHGEKFDAAYQGIIAAAQNEPEARIAIQRIWNAANPGGELMRWHRDRETLREVGNDTEGYRKKIADDTRAALLADPEFRKEIIAAMKGGDGNSNPAPRHVVRVPGKQQIPSLNGASGSSQLTDTTFDDASEGAFFTRALAG